jgi:hypothetical protein
MTRALTPQNFGLEAALDPVMYVFEYSDNGTEWRTFASSRTRDVCGYRGARTQQTRADVTEFLLSDGSCAGNHPRGRALCVREPTTDRGVKETFNFESPACLWPTHVCVKSVKRDLVYCQRDL